MGAAIGRIIAWFMAHLSRLVGSSLGPWLGMALLSLGIEVVIIGATLSPFIADARAAMNGIPGDVAAWAGVLNVDIYISMYLSALLIAEGKQAGRMALLQAGRR